MGKTFEYERGLILRHDFTMYVLEKRKVNIFVYYNVNAYKTVSKNSSIKIRSVHSRKMKMEKDYCTFFFQII